MAGLFEKRNNNLLLLIFLSLVFLIAQKSFAQDITTGNASAKSEIRTEVQGDSHSPGSGQANVYTKIEVEANGEKKVLESNEPGTHKLEVESPSTSLRASASAEQQIEDADEAESDKTSPKLVVQRIFEAISKWFKNIFSFFS